MCNMRVFGWIYHLKPYAVPKIYKVLMLWICRRRQAWLSTGDLKTNITTDTAPMHSQSQPVNQWVRMIYNPWGLCYFLQENRSIKPGRFLSIVSYHIWHGCMENALCETCSQSCLLTVSVTKFLDTTVSLTTPKLSVCTIFWAWSCSERLQLTACMLEVALSA